MKDGVNLLYYMVKTFECMLSKWSRLKKITYEISHNLCAKQIRYFYF